MIEYKIGNALDIQSNNTILFPHIINRDGGWGKGYVLSISKKWKGPELEYRKWVKEYKEKTGDKLPLGAIQIVEVGEKTYVINMCAQDGFKSFYNPVPLNYNALHTCLLELDKWIQENNLNDPVISLPRIGCGLGGASWDNVEKILNTTLNKYNIFVYDLKEQV